jgi:hypothetical protein
MLMHEEKDQNTVPIPSLTANALTIALPHKSILGETVVCTLCEALPYGLPGGLIV